MAMLAFRYAPMLGPGVGSELITLPPGPTARAMVTVCRPMWAPSSAIASRRQYFRRKPDE
jgi:hypothetical protein